MEYTPIPKDTQKEVTSHAGLAIKLFIGFITIAVILSVALNVYLLLPKEQPEEITSKTIPQQVAELVYVPEGEPTIAEITNLQALRIQQPTFYKYAVNGDVLVVYEDRAVIYRESENKL